MQNLANTQPQTVAISGDTLTTPASDGAMFQLPAIGASFPAAQDLAEAAQRNFKEQIAQRADRPDLHQVRAQLLEMVPVVREVLHEIQVFNTNYFVFGDMDERHGDRAQVPPVVAQFAVMALAFMEEMKHSADEQK